MTVAGAAAVGVTASNGTAEAGVLTGGCATSDWPAATDDRIEIDGNSPVERGEIPAWGDLVIYVHGLFGDDLLDSIDINGANQAAALDQALSEQGVHTPVVAAMWNSSTTWTVAKSRADSAGETLAQWLEANRWRYGSVTLVAHSLGARVTLTALSELAGTGVTVDSVALLGGAVDPDTACEDYYHGIETSVTGSVYNYHSGDDGIVCTVYAIREFGSAIGCNGSDCSGGWFSDDGELPTNFEDVDLTGDVTGHCNFLKPESMDFDDESAVPDIIERQF